MNDASILFIPLFVLFGVHAPDANGFVIRASEQKLLGGMVAQVAGVSCVSSHSISNLLADDIPSKDDVVLRSLQQQMSNHEAVDECGTYAINIFP